MNSVYSLTFRAKFTFFFFIHSLLEHCGGSKGSALRLRLTGSVVQPMSCYDLLSYKAIGSNYLSFVVTSMLVSTSPLDEAGTATTRIDTVCGADCKEKFIAMVVFLCFEIFMH